MAYSSGVIIAGAPQYRLGTYLSALANKITLDVITSGNHTEKDIEKLDMHLEKKIENINQRKAKIYFHFLQRSIRMKNILNI